MSSSCLIIALFYEIGVTESNSYVRILTENTEIAISAHAQCKCGQKCWLNANWLPWYPVSYRKLGSLNPMVVSEFWLKLGNSSFCSCSTDLAQNDWHDVRQHSSCSVSQLPRFLVMMIILCRLCVVLCCVVAYFTCSVDAVRATCLCFSVITEQCRHSNLQHIYNASYAHDACCWCKHC